MTGYISFIQPSIKFMNIIDGNSVNNLAFNCTKISNIIIRIVHRNLNIFYVNEDKRFEGAKYSIGGITSANDKAVDLIAEARVIKQIILVNMIMTFPFKIDKEAMSLKEIDFKLRKYLIDNYGLYGEMSTGKITVKKEILWKVYI